MGCRTLSKPLSVKVMAEELSSLSCRDLKDIIIVELELRREEFHLSDFHLMAAEEDGSRMDDLPEFMEDCDVANMGIEDFLLFRGSEPIVNIRCTRQSTEKKDSPPRVCLSLSEPNDISTSFRSVESLDRFDDSSSSEVENGSQQRGAIEDNFLISYKWCGKS